MALTDSQTPILLIILIIISSVIGGLILVICATIICRYCYKMKMRRERTKSSCDETMSKSQSTITIYRNRKASRIDSVTATEVDEESITALVKKYKDTIDKDHCDISNSTGSIKELFKVITPTKDISSADIFNSCENNKATMKDILKKDSSCQTFITLDDILYTQKVLTVKTEITNHSNDREPNEESSQNQKSNNMYHIVPPTDYRRNSQHLRPFDTHWGSNTLSRSFDLMPSQNISNESRKTYSFDECETNPQPKATVIRTNSFDNRYPMKQTDKHSLICRKQISVTSGQSSRTSSSISTVSMSQNYHENNICSIPNKYSTIYTRVRSCSRLGKDISSVNSSFNSSSETNNCIIRSNHEINRPIVLNNSVNPCRRKCNSERSPVRKVFVTRVTSKSLESRESNWQPGEMSENHIIQRPMSSNKFVDRYLQKQNSECYPRIAKYPSSQYRQSQVMRHKSMDISKNINDRSRSKTNSYLRNNSELERNQISIESEETLDRNAEPHLSRIGLVNISVDNSEHQFNNYQIIPDLVNSSVKDEKSFRDSIHKSNRNPFQNLCRSNTSLETSNNLATSAAARRRQFSQERRRVDPNRKDSKGSLSKSVYDDFSSFMLDNLDDRKGKSMIFDRFFNSQIIPTDPIEPKFNKMPSIHYFNTESNGNKDTKTEENRQGDFRCQNRVPSKYFRSNSQNQDTPERWINQSQAFNDSRSNSHLNNAKNPIINRTQRSKHDILSKSIDRTIPKIIFPDNE